MFALLSSLYGISTNIIGILVAQNITALSCADTFTVALSGGLGVMLEIVPEAQFTWGVTGMCGHDFLSNIIPDNWGRKQGRGGGNQQQQRGQQQNQGGHQP